MTMMKKLLLVVWCVKLADVKPLHPEFTAQYIFTSSKQVKNPSTKYPQTIKHIGKSKITEPFLVPSFSAPEEFSSSKHESGYSMLSKSFTNSIGPTKDGHDDGSKFILDNRVLYHSLTNPLFKSKSLNLNDENDYPRVIGDIYKFSSPFESKWLFSPKFSKLVDGKSPIREFQSIFHALKINKLRKQPESAIEPPPDSVFPAPSNLDLERYNKLGDESIDTSLPSLENLGKDQFDEIVKDNTDILTDIDNNALFKSIEKSNFNHVVPKNGSYIGYNLQEVKTPQGEVRGIMQIFDKNGLAQKIHYNDKGIVDKTVASNTTSSQKLNTKLIPTIPNKDIKNPLHNVVKTAVKQLKENGNVNKPNLAKSTQKINSGVVPAKKPALPEVKKISVKIEGHNYSNSSSPQHNYNSYPINELKSPENILSDFLQQLNGVSDASDDANVRTDVHNSFHETVSENSYSYT